MGLNGIINVLKPPGMTSSDVVVYLRKKLQVKKIGHTGTLDPAAAGVLLLCIGKATKLAEYIMLSKKSYRGEMVLGTETDTLDADGEIISQTASLPDTTQIEKAFQQYQGAIKQVPPMYSAIKHKGKRLYELARKGQQVDVPVREIMIYTNKVIKISPPNRILFEVECSKGTYIRSLCRDIGQTLGCGAYLSFLLRTQNGMFSVDNSSTIDEIESFAALGMLERIIVPMDAAIHHFKSVHLEDSMYEKIINGNRIPVEFANIQDDSVESKDLLRVYCRQEFIGIGFINQHGMIQMRKILH